MKKHLKIILCAISLAAATAVWAQDTANTSAADEAWQALSKRQTMPQPPAAWRTNMPSQEVREQWMAEHVKPVLEQAEQAKAFYTKYPDHEKAAAARQMETSLLRTAAMMGDEGAKKRVDEVEAAMLKDPKTPEATRFRLRQQQVMRDATKGLTDRKEYGAAMEKAARQLLEEFPKKAEAYGMLLQAASMAEPDKARSIAKEVIAGTDNDKVKEQAEGLQRKLEAVGKPLDIKFTAVDGREVDLAKLKGKVVLVDFWATWCGPCVMEVPHVVAAYEKLHEKGFEIVGISFDREGDKEKLTKFTSDKKMPWPQYFDGKFWQNEYGKKYGINSIPAMWLVDKKGNLRDQNGRDDLAGKVEKLLAE
jgi:thiol-disulfide isomerase/thioredoxin